MRACALVLLVAACGDNLPALDAAPVRQIAADVVVGASGVSDPVAFIVPAATRSITVVATGGDDALYALGSFITADGVEHVVLDAAAPPGPAMRSAYYDEQSGQMPGGLYQSIRLGTFTHVYPYRPDQAVVPGTVSVRVASDRPGPVHLTVLMPADDDGKVLHVNLIAVSDTYTVPEDPPFMQGLREIFAQAGITVVVDARLALPGTGLSAITQSTEPQESPPSMAAQLPALVRDRVSASAVDVFLVDSLPAGIGGLSLGTPGPPVHGSYYDGVLALHDAPPVEVATVIAHETCHFLALQHVVNRGASGTIYPDPLDDTQPGQMNLMENGTKLTPDQAFALSRSALLQGQ